jgi:GT2 family glycosyltransferase
MRQYGPYRRITVNPHTALAGSNCVYRKSVIEEVGYYNERFRTNAEDVDLYHRVRARGYKLVYDPTAVCFHWCRDTIGSLLKRAWNYGFADRLFLNNFRGFIKRIALNAYDSVRYMWRDFKIGKYDALMIDFLIFPYWSKFAWENYLKNQKRFS